MFFALPMSITLLVTFAFLLTKVLFKVDRFEKLNPHRIEESKNNLPPMSYEEKWVSLIFISTAVLWIFRKTIHLGSFTIPGWSNLLSYPALVDDGTVAIAMATLLFFIPAPSTKNRENILNSSVIKEIPWATLLLFGGGFALAKGFKLSGLADAIGHQFSGMSVDSPFILISSVTGGISFLTELTSNTATTEMILPILASVSDSLNINPLYLMVSATIAASCAFMLPVATPPNAIIFGSGKVTIKTMAKTGFILNIIAVAVASLFIYFYMPLIFM
jgi:sodium-dependent dicarboxylate transporter 2/3/5